MNRRYFVKGVLLTGAAALMSLGLTQRVLPILDKSEEDVDLTFQGQFGKILFAYYTLTGHTRNIMSHIRKFTGGDLFEIATAETYNLSTIEAVAREEVRTKFTPALRNHLPNPEGYDLIFIGSPIWWFSMASPVLTFVRKTALANKIIVPFCTHDGNYGQYFDRITAECPAAKILQGRDFQNSTSVNKTDLNNRIKDWLAGINKHK